MIETPVGALAIPARESGPRGPGSDAPHTNSGRPPEKRPELRTNPLVATHDPGLSDNPEIEGLTVTFASRHSEEGALHHGTGSTFVAALDSVGERYGPTDDKFRRPPFTSKYDTFCC